MNKFLCLLVALLLAASAFGQKAQTSSSKKAAPARKTASNQAKKPPQAKKTVPNQPKKTASTATKKPVTKSKPVPTPIPIDPAAEKAQLDKALALPSAAEKAAALKKFVHDFPKSEHRSRALESLVTARAILGDEKLEENQSAEAVELFKLAVREAPVPIPERLFNEIVSKFPANLFYRGERTAGVEIARAIEKMAAGNASQLLSLAAFYLGVESGDDAKRLAEAAIAVEPNSLPGYQTLGLAHRLNFDLEESARAYSKALELDASSVASKRSLAEMQRALSKPGEAAALYREIIASNEGDSSARTGLILSLFGSGKKDEAEAEMTRALEQNPKNPALLAGAAYWYAANNSSEKAIELAKRAVEIEPRYIWSHIALARGLMGQNKPVEAERVLVMARQYGNFPTLEYEIASARLMSGFYREAAEELQKSFAVRDGVIQTRLGGRVLREGKTFVDLVGYERRASIFEPIPADNPDTALKLKLLFEITQKLAADAPDETELAALADDFVQGNDRMKLHRQIYSATQLLQKNVALPKVLELVKAAVANTDAGLEVSTPAAAVMASELYESRTVAFARNEMIVVPDVPRQTLSAILRGRIEELAGWTLYQQKSYPEAIVRLRRAISVLPEKSAWWRSSMWRLGAVLEAAGKDKEALDSYILSYKTDRPNVLRYAVVEALYKKVHGGTDGLEAKIGLNPLPATVAAEPAKSPETMAKSADPPETPVQDPPKTEESVTTSDDAGVMANEPAKTKVEETKTDPLDEPLKTNDAVPPKADPPEPAQAPVTLAKSEPLKTAISDDGLPPTEPEKTKAEALAATEKGKPEITTAETPAKISETAEQKTEEIGPPSTQTEAKAPPVELPSNEVEGRPTITETVKREGPEVKISTSETQKAENLPQSSLVEEPVKTDASVSSKPLPKTGVTANSQTGADEPRNLFRDPFAPETAEPQREEPSVTGTEKAPSQITPLVIDGVADGKKPAIVKDLFEPVIINVPAVQPRPQRKESEKLAELSKTEGEQLPEKPKAKVEEPVSSGALRARVVDGKEIKPLTTCSLEVDQESISLINAGGSLGILVSISGEVGFDEVTATSNSPQDVEVRAEPEIAGISGRRFYVIKSVSTSTGVYQATFESKCGKKDITVRVR